MELQTFFSLIIIGLLAGILSGFIGIGGGIIMVPALVYVLGITQHEAQGISITTMLLPIGILAFYNYYKGGQITNDYLIYSLIIAVAFVIGGFFGSKISLKLNPQLIKFIFGFIMLYVGFKMITSGWEYFKK